MKEIFDNPLNLKIGIGNAFSLNTLKKGTLTDLATEFFADTTFFVVQAGFLVKSHI